MKQRIVMSESDLRQIVRESIKRMLTEDVIGFDWKKNKDGKYINPNNKQGNDRSTKGYKVGDTVVNTSTNRKTGKTTTKTYTKTRDAIPHQEVAVAENLVCIRGYKQFRYNPNTPGVVYPLYVNTEFDASHKQGLKKGVWYASGNGELWVQKENGRSYTASSLDFLANRSGWHLIDTPWGNQRGGTQVAGRKYADGTGKFAHTNEDEVWALCEIYGECVDDEARKQGKKPKDQYLQEVPKGKWYHYKTNSNGSDDVSWIIADKIRIVEILDDDTIDAINDEYFKNKPTAFKDSKGRERLTYYKMPRVSGNRLSKNDLQKMGF